MNSMRLRSSGNIDDWEKKKKFSFKDWQDTKKNIKKSYQLVKGHKKDLIIYIIINALMMPMSILSPLLTARILLDFNNNLYEDLLKVAAFILIVYVIQNILNYFSRIIHKKYLTRITYSIQKELMNKTFEVETKHFDNNGTGLFIDRLQGDTGSIATIFDHVSTIIIEIFSNIGVFIVIFTISKIMFLYFILMGIKDIIISKVRMQEYYKRLQNIRDIEEKNTGLVSEFIRGVRDIRVLNAKKVFMKKFEKRIWDANEESIRLTEYNSKMWLIGDTVSEIMDFGFYLLGVILVKNDLLLASNFLVLYMYKSNIRFWFGFLTQLVDVIKSFNFSANRVFEIIDGNKFSKEKFGKKVIKRILGNFEFKNVSFSYNEKKEILHNISFKVKANTTVAFVGKSGSGKTTIFSLIEKLYEVPNNKIFIDGIDINDLTRDSLRDNISIITQNPYIFNLSIKDNLLLAKDNVSENEMIKACKLACIHDFIETLPDKYDTIVGEGGITLSGGERQRLAIARALIKKTNVILFDEATSSLDNETQEKIQKAIHNLQGEYTILIIAHRLSTIVNSDDIILIDKGKIIDSGTHKELMKKSKSYYKLYHAEEMGKKIVGEK